MYRILLSITILLVTYIQCAYTDVNPVPFSHGIMTDIKDTDIPLESEIITSITFLAARNEFEPFSLGLYSSASGTWKVEVSDLKNNRMMIPSSTVEIASLRYGNPGRYKYFEDWILIPGTKTVNCQKNKSSWLWLTIHVPENAHPGNYSGTFTLSSNQSKFSLPVQLEVLPIEHEPVDSVHFYLLSTTSPYGPYYRSVNNPSALKPEVVAFYRELKEHGMTGMSTKSTDFPYRKGSIEGLIAEVEAALEAGLDGPILWNMIALIDAAKGGDRYDFNGRMDNWNEEDDLARLMNLHRTASAEAQHRGWPEIIYYPVDEPGTQFEERRFLIQSMDLLVILSREIGLIGSRAHSTITECVDEKHNRAPRWSKYPDEMRDLWDRARPYLHIRNYGYGYPQGRTNLFHEQADAKDREQEVWFYHNEAIQSRDRYCTRLYFGLWGWKVKADGLTVWTYPGARTIQFELVREGIDDYKYISALQRLISRKKGKPEDRDAALTFLKKLNESIELDENGFITDWHEAAASAARSSGNNYSENTDEFYRIKYTMAGLIKKLAKP